MFMTQSMQRRKMLKISLGALAGAPLLAGTAAEACAPATPAQTEGPFYPVSRQADRDWDLTSVAGRSGAPLGEKIYIAGQVVDQNCEPVAGALVEIWQAAASGRYNHPGDTSGLALDPNFQYWGRVLTDDQGQYLFRTIIPGDYPASPTWRRPPHIHYKVQKRGFRELTTQMYFAGHALNTGDFILQALPAGEKDRVLVALQDAGRDSASGQDMDLRWARFDIGIERLG
jgi:protocatechuate 3,4-dioxygenase beta subunit